MSQVSRATFAHATRRSLPASPACRSFTERAMPHLLVSKLRFGGSVGHGVVKEWR